jgi:hypothetical protein
MPLMHLKTMNSARLSAYQFVLVYALTSTTKCLWHNWHLIRANYKA